MSEYAAKALEAMAWQVVGVLLLAFGGGFALGVCVGVAS